MEHRSSAASSRRTSSQAGEQSDTALLQGMVTSMVIAMQEAGITTELAGKIVGGVALAHPFYVDALYSEGRVPEGALAGPCQVVFTAPGENGMELIPATQEELLSGRPHLPRESAVISQLLSPAAITTYHWGRPPGVIVFGYLVADDDALDRCEESGLPVSPSMVGPHPEELITQLQVFFKQYRYPEHKAFVLMDWGFMVFGSTIEDAAAAFDASIRTHLMGNPPAAAEAAGGTSSGAGALGGLAGALRRLGGLLNRSHSEPPESLPTPAAVRASGAGAAAVGGACMALSEPSSPMLGVLQAARANFSTGSAVGSCGGAAAVGGKGQAAAEQLPEEVRTAPGQHKGRRESDQYRIPSFHTGLKPW